MRQPKVHRWQPNGRTPCGRLIEEVRTNHQWQMAEASRVRAAGKGQPNMMRGVTCRACLAATTFVREVVVT